MSTEGKQYYCCGLLFSGRTLEQATRLLTIRKKKPAWQAGLLNGIGGKIEPGETALASMYREAKEELGVAALNLWMEWLHFASEEGPDYLVHFYAALISTDWRTPNARNDAGEEFCWVPLPNGMHNGRDLVGNLRWLVPLAQDWRRLSSGAYGPRVVYVQSLEDDISRRPSW